MCNQPIRSYDNVKLGLNVSLASLRRGQLTSLLSEARVSNECDEPIAARITTHPLNARFVYFREDPSEVVTDKRYVYLTSNIF